MPLHPYSSSYTASQANYTPNLANQTNQQTLSSQQLAQLATASWANRLNSLLEKLEDLIATAAAAANPNQTNQLEADYLAYVMARLGGEETVETPESLGEFAYEVDSLIEDVLAAWEALKMAGELGDELPEMPEFESIDGILAMLNHIAQRRVQSLLANQWYTQWRQVYRDLVDGDLSDPEAGHQAYGSLPNGVDLIEAEQAVNDGQNLPTNALVKLLQDALEMRDPDGLYIVKEKNRQAIHHLLQSQALV